jgi:hypothetical protein
VTYVVDHDGPGRFTIKAGAWGRAYVLVAQP